MFTATEQFHHRLMAIEGQAYILMKKMIPFMSEDMKAEAERIIKEHKELVINFLKS